jgi:ribose-phosphate pyrophosphokinase
MPYFGYYARQDRRNAKDSILVAPYLGVVKLDQSYADLRDLSAGYIHRVRLSGEKVRVRGLIGEVNARSLMMVDDMISTGGTIVSALDALMDASAELPMTVSTTHGLLVNQADQNFSQRSIGKIIVTDSVHQSGSGE